MIKATLVQSSMISEVAYVPASSVEDVEIGPYTLKVETKPEGGALIVQFNKPPDIYCFDPVDIQTYNDLMDADSIGKAFHAKIRNSPQYNMLKLDMEKVEWIRKEKEAEL